MVLIKGMVKGMKWIEVRKL